MPQQQWLRTALFTGLGYAAVGVATAALARATSSPDLRTVARLGAWGASALLFGMHIGLERRLHNPPSRAAGHTTLAVVVATGLLAMVAVVHQFRAGTLHGGTLLAVAVWPLLTGVVSFAVAVIAFAALARMDRRTVRR